MVEKALHWLNTASDLDLGTGYKAEVYTSLQLAQAAIPQYINLVRKASPGLRSYMFERDYLLPMFLGILPECRVGVRDKNNISDVPYEQVEELKELIRQYAPDVMTVDVHSPAVDFERTGISVFNRTSVTRAIQRSSFMFPQGAADDPISWLQNQDNQPLWDEYHYVSNNTTARYGLFSGMPQTAQRVYTKWLASRYTVEDALRVHNVLPDGQAMLVRMYYMGQKNELNTQELQFARSYIEGLTHFLSPLEIKLQHASNIQGGGRLGGFVGFNPVKDNEFMKLKWMIYNASGAAKVEAQLMDQYTTQSYEN